MADTETIPENQDHSLEKPILIPQYQYVKLAPTNYLPKLPAKDKDSTQTVTFEIPGDNVINFANTYLEYDVTLTGKWHNDLDNLPQEFHQNYSDTSKTLTTEYGIEEVNLKLAPTFNIAQVRVYNQNGVNLFLADDTYNTYIDLIRKIVNRKEDQHNTSEGYYDGYHFRWDDEEKKYISDCMINTYDYNYFDKWLTDAGYSGPFTIHQKYKSATKQMTKDIPINTTFSYTFRVKLFFKELYNSILSLKSDIWFGEKIKIDIKFGIKDKFGCIENIYALNNEEKYDHCDEGFEIEPLRYHKLESVELNKFFLYACYNQDSACNENTINYCLNNEIHINDFHCARHTTNVLTTQDHYVYQFNANSAYGSYLKFIIYRNWYNKQSEHTEFDEDISCFWHGAKFRWMLNDFPMTVDYLDCENYDSYERLRPILQGSIYDLNSEKNFMSDFFDIINFGNEKLDDQQVVCGKPLDNEYKFTFDAYNPKWKQMKDGQLLINDYYIITGRMLKIGKMGIEAVI